MTSRLLPALLLVALTTATCGTPKEAAKEEPPTLSVTHWTDTTELFMEYPPLVSGQSARFAVHLTTLKDFKALNAGRPSAEFVPERGGAATVFPGTDPLRPGAFRVEGVPPAPGTYRWALLVDAPGRKASLPGNTVAAPPRSGTNSADGRPAFNALKSLSVVR